MNAETNTGNYIGQLTQVLFVFHAWQNINILGPDGPLFHLDTRMLDVDGEAKNPETGKTVGIPYLKRLRLIPITTTPKAIIDNREGFAVSNVFLGSIGHNGQPEGLGSNMAAGIKTNVKQEWVYPEQKISDMVYTYGKFGLIRIHSLRASDEKQIAQCQKIFRTVMSGIDDRILLEDLPEYFGEVSPYLLDKKPTRFANGTAIDIVEEAGQRGKLNAQEYTQATILISELAQGVLTAHAAALDPEQAGVLPQTQEGLQTKQKNGYDKFDRWLMGQFPSYPMDTELEKSQKQLIRALDEPRAASGESPDGFVSAEVFEEERKRNDDLQKRLEALENAAKAKA